MSKSINGISMGLAGLVIFAMVLRFWGLGRFNTLAFDEIYSVKFANDYLHQIPFFDAHPPLGKYLIAFGIELAEHIPFLNALPKNNGTGSLLTPISYRWMNALVGACVPLVIAGMAYQLSQPLRIYPSANRSIRPGLLYALIAGFVAAMDGLLLVESRYGLINIYMVFFGLLGHWLFLRSLTSPYKWRQLWLSLSGVSLGACISVKWNGLGFLLGLYLLWAIALAVRWVALYPIAFRVADYCSLIGNKQHGKDGKRYYHLAQKLISVAQRLIALELILPKNLFYMSWQTILIKLGLLPALFYGVIWIPHLQINQTGLGVIHGNIWNFHQQVGNTPGIHPYCSAWYSWPLMIRPVAYFRQVTASLTESADVLGPPNPYGQTVYVVHGMGNPILWWLSTAAILLMIGKLIQQAWTMWRAIAVKPYPSHSSLYDGQISTPFPPRIALYLVINFVANWLPWMLVKRCTFLYLYMGASCFGFLAIAWILTQWFTSRRSSDHMIGWLTFSLILFAFLYWLPLHLGLPLYLDALQDRWWLPSWE
ncbi:MAG: phospholipid carrier-dependent glycosyltransferase [Pseudanabaenales cyanobacterium]|nr:phospholipid carrier-dependent glycosyltransferase [Pseudanabaenales cyanobacterium]